MSRVFLEWLTWQRQLGTLLSMTRRTDPKALEIGGRIRGARVAVTPRMSQEALARRLGVSVNTVLSWEKGAFVPSGKLIDELCDALGITPNALFGWDADDTMEDDQ